MGNDVNHGARAPERVHQVLELHSNHDEGLLTKQILRKQLMIIIVKVMLCYYDDYYEYCLYIISCYYHY